MVASISLTNRSRVSNGSKLLNGVDGRSPRARRYRDLLRGYEDQYEIETESDRTLVRNAASLAFEQEEMAAAKIRGERVDGDDVVRVSSELRRVLSDLKGKAQDGAPAAPLSLAEQWAANHHDNDEREA